MLLLYLIIKTMSSHFLANYKQNMHIFKHRVINILSHIVMRSFIHELYTIGK